MQHFPEIREIRLVGLVARGEHTGLSDIDLFITADKAGEAYQGNRFPDMLD